jgi:hypothetical protein
MLLRRRAVDDVVPARQLVEQLRDLLGWVLEVVVDRDDDLSRRGADACQQGVVLAVVAHQLDPVDTRVLRRDLGNAHGALVDAAVVDEHDLVVRAVERGLDPVDECRHRAGAVVHGDDDRERVHEGVHGISVNQRR